MLREPLGDQAGDHLPRLSETGGVGVGGRVQVGAVRGALDVHALLGGLRQLGGGVVGDPQGVPGVDGAAGEGDVGAGDAHRAVLLVDPAHLKLRESG